MKRAKHTLSHYRLTTADMGQLVPIQCVPVLPGDTMQGHSAAMIRLAPLNTPVMHPVNVRVHHFYVPNRIIWEGWEDFITGGEDGMSTEAIPTMLAGGSKRTLTHKLGVPISGVGQVSALPVMATNMIFNEYYRDQHLVPKRSLTENSIPRCAWEKDYFTTSRPWAQLGPQVSIPVGGEVESDIPTGSLSISNGAGGYNVLNSSGAELVKGGIGLAENVLSVNAEGISVNDFRAAFSIQRYQEARARYGARFTEYLRYLGITPSDARLQRPEWLGGGSSRLQFSEVLQTAPGAETDDYSVGDLYGHGIGGLKSNRFRKFFEEHGFIISILSVRPKSIYTNGIPREWLKETKEDYFQRELANLGQQEVFADELFYSAANVDRVFSYQDRYHEYRSHPSQILGDFLDLLNAWHLGRDLPEAVNLNQAFIECDPSKRIFQVTDDQIDSLWCMVNNHLVARRMVPKRANPRVL